MPHSHKRTNCRRFPQGIASGEKDVAIGSFVPALQGFPSSIEFFDFGLRESGTEQTFCDFCDRVPGSFRIARGEISVGSILPFIARSGAVFNDLDTQVMGEAFDAACRELHDKGQPTIVYEVIAKRIIDAAKKGERDPVRLRNAGLAALGFDKEDKEAG